MRAPVDMPIAWVEDKSDGKAPGVIAAGLSLKQSLDQMDGFR